MTHLQIYLRSVGITSNWKANNDNAEVNLEVQFNRITIHSKSFMENLHSFPDRLDNTNSDSHNYFTGISKDLSCLTTKRILVLVR